MSPLWTFTFIFLCIALVASIPVSLSTSTLGLNVLNSSFFDDSVAATNVNQALNVTLPDPPEFNIWRIRGTPTFLRIAMLSRSIPETDLNDVILDTNQTLYDAIRRHYITKEEALSPFDDPYESPTQWAKCFINIRTYEKENPHLTYGVIANVLQGLWDYMIQGNRPREAAFEVHDDVFGFVGIGKVTRTPPRA